MLKLILFIFANAGITYQITSAKIFESFRCFFQKRSEFLHKLITCSLCLSTWLSIPIYTLVFWNHWCITDIVPFMFLGSITSYFLYLVLTNKYLR